SNLNVAEDAGNVTVECDVANTGSRGGSEVVQVYVHDAQSSMPRPDKELKGFARVKLEPGEKQTVKIPLSPRALAFYDPDRSAWVSESGDFSILVGSSSRDIRLQGGVKLPETHIVP